MDQDLEGLGVFAEGWEQGGGDVGVACADLLQDEGDEAVGVGAGGEEEWDEDEIGDPVPGEAGHMPEEQVGELELEHGVFGDLGVWLEACLQFGHERVTPLCVAGMTVTVGDGEDRGGLGVGGMREVLQDGLCHGGCEGGIGEEWWCEEEGTIRVTLAQVLDDGGVILAHVLSGEEEERQCDDDVGLVVLDGLLEFIGEPVPAFERLHGGAQQGRLGVGQGCTQFVKGIGGQLTRTGLAAAVIEEDDGDCGCVRHRSGLEWKEGVFNVRTIGSGIQPLGGRR